MCPIQEFRKARKAHIRDIRAKVGYLRPEVFRVKPPRFYVSFPSTIQLGTQVLTGCLGIFSLHFHVRSGGLGLGSGEDP